MTTAQSSKFYMEKKMVFLHCSSSLIAIKKINDLSARHIQNSRDDKGREMQSTWAQKWRVVCWKSKGIIISILCIYKLISHNLSLFFTYCNLLSGNTYVCVYIHVFEKIWVSLLLITANGFQVINQIQTFMNLIILYRASHLTRSFMMVMMTNLVHLI